MRKRKERKRHDSLALFRNHKSKRMVWATFGGTACFYQSIQINKKTGCDGLAWLLLTEDDEYRFSFVRD
jgi:hypothetical protein